MEEAEKDSEQNRTRISIRAEEHVRCCVLQHLIFLSRRISIAIRPMKVDLTIASAERRKEKEGKK